MLKLFNNRRSRSYMNRNVRSLYNLAVIGYGRMGIIHSQNIINNSKTNLAGVIARDNNKAEKVLKSYDINTSIIKLDEALNRDDIDGIVISSGTDAHYDHIMKSLSAGKPILCEKPIALNVDQVEECYQLSERLSIPLLCAFNRRYDDSMLKLYDYIHDGHLGAVHQLIITSRDHPPPDVSVLSAHGSFFDDFSVHDIDTAQWLMGENNPIVDVFARGSSFLPEYQKVGLDDTACLVLKFQSGAVCIIENSRRSTYGYDVRVEVLGDNGMVQVRNPSNTTTVMADISGFHHDLYPYSFPQRFEKAYQNEMNHFVTILDQHNNKSDHKKLLEYEKCFVTPQQARNVCDIAKKAEKSRQKQPEMITKLNKELNISPIKDPIRKDIGICLIGAGRMGGVRASAVNTYAGANLVSVVDVTEDSSKTIADEYNVKSYNIDNIDEALQDPNVDAVIISSVSSVHRELIETAAKHGKHVFVEKPVALSSDDTNACMKVVEDNQLLLYCGFQRRWDPSFEKLRLNAQSSEQIEHVRISCRDGATHNSVDYLVSSGSYLYDSVIHDIDGARDIIQEEPLEVYAYGTCFDKKTAGGGMDSICVILRFPSGAICTINNHRSAKYGYDQRYEVHTNESCINADNFYPTSVTVANEDSIVHDVTVSGLERYAIAYESEVHHFLDLLSGKSNQPRVSPNDCIQGARIADAAMESLKTGKPVRI